MARILFITDNFLPHLGGSRIVFYNICRRLPAGEVFVLTKFLRGSGEFDRRQKFKIFRVFLFKLPQKIFGFLSEVPLYISLFVSAIFAVLVNKAKIIFAGETLPCGFIAFLLKKTLGIPYIVFTFAEDITIVSRLNRESAIQRIVIRGADVIIATCSFIEEFLENKIGVSPKKIVKIYPAVDDEIIEFKINIYKLKELKNKKELEGKKVIFSCARLIERKGIDNVIQALPRVVENIPQVIYLIGGDGEYRNRLEGLVKENELNEYVRFLGNINHYEELPYFYALCDVFILPSRQLESFDIEGFGIVYLEANAFGKPVIGPNIGGPRDAIIDKVTGLQVNPYDEEAIAEAIITLLNDEGYAKRLGEAGRERVRNEFRWQDRTNTIYQISQRIIKRLSG